LTRILWNVSSQEYAGSVQKGKWENEFLSLERLMLEDEVRHSIRHLERLIHEGFKEIGSSGRVYDKTMMIDMMMREDRRGRGDVVIRDFRAIPLAPDCTLVTYRTVGASAQVRRSSVWVQQDGRWRLIFHQGTKVPSRIGGVVLPGR
jgi:hypothetical protein